MTKNNWEEQAKDFTSADLEALVWDRDYWKTKAQGWADRYEKLQGKYFKLKGNIMFVKGDKVRLRKLRASDNPPVRTPTKEEHTPGEQNPTTSLPVDYEMEGTLLADIEEGKALHMFRSKRNGVEMPGITQTSFIVGMNLDEGGGSVILETENSVYTIERI